MAGIDHIVYNEGPYPYPSAPRPDTHAPDVNGHMRYLLTVSETERLAKAGVKVDFSDVRLQIRADDKPTPPRLFDCTETVKPLLDRWNSATRVNHTRDFEARPFPFFFSASIFEDKVYVFVASHNAEPVILTDPVDMYPSDALLAKLHLMNKFHKNEKP